MANGAFIENMSGGAREGLVHTVGDGIITVMSFYYAYQFVVHVDQLLCKCHHISYRKNILNGIQILLFCYW